MDVTDLNMDKMGNKIEFVRNKNMPILEEKPRNGKLCQF